MANSRLLQHIIHIKCSKCVRNQLSSLSIHLYIGIVADSYCRPLLRKPGGLYESVECEHRAACTMHLIGQMEATVLLPGFDDREVDRLLDMLCCD